MGATTNRLFSAAAVGLVMLLSSPDVVGEASVVEPGRVEPGQVEAGDSEDKPATKEVALAVIVNQNNPTTNLKFRDLRKLLRVDKRNWEKKYWAKKPRCVLYLPATDSDARTVLLNTVYGKTEKELRRYWTRKVFSGDITREPSVARTARAAGILVGKSDGGLSVVLSTEIPKGVKVLQIDGKKPGDKGYVLVGEVESVPADVSSRP